MSFIRGALLGQYKLRGVPEAADCLIGLAHGDSTNPASVNAYLAYRAYVEHQKSGLPMLLQSEVAAAMPPGAAKPVMIASGEISSASGEGLDSWGVLEQAAEYTAEHDLRNPLLLAQAFHVGRVAMQAERLGLDPIVPPNLPRDFYRWSSQSWTRALPLWIPRELAGAVVLKARGQL